MSWVDISLIMINTEHINSQGSSLKYPVWKNVSKLVKVIILEFALCGIVSLFTQFSITNSCSLKVQCNMWVRAERHILIIIYTFPTTQLRQLIFKKLHDNKKIHSQCEKNELFLQSLHYFVNISETNRLWNFTTFRKTSRSPKLVVSMLPQREVTLNTASEHNDADVYKVQKCVSVVAALTLHCEVTGLFPATGHNGWPLLFRRANCSFANLQMDVMQLRLCCEELAQN